MEELITAYRADDHWRVFVALSDQGPIVDVMRVVSTTESKDRASVIVTMDIGHSVIVPGSTQEIIFRRIIKAMDDFHGRVHNSSNGLG